MAARVEPGLGNGLGQAGVWLPLGTNLDGLWPKRSKRRHQTLQGPPDSLRTMSAVPGGMQQEHHIQQGLWTHCQRGPDPEAGSQLATWAPPAVLTIPGLCVTAASGCCTPSWTGVREKM